MVYGDLVYKFKRIVGKPNFSDQLKKIVKRYIRVGYNLHIMLESACLVLNQITVYSYGFLFNCTTVGQALLNLSSWCLMMVERLLLQVPQGCLQFVIVVFPDHTHLLFWTRYTRYKIQETLFSFGYSTTNNISYKSYFPT